MQDCKKENLIGVLWLLAFPLLANYQVDMSEFCRKLQGRRSGKNALAIYYFKAMTSVTPDDTRSLHPKGIHLR